MLVYLGCCWFKMVPIWYGYILELKFTDSISCTFPEIVEEKEEADGNGRRLQIN